MSDVDTHPAFEHIRSREVATLNLTVHEFAHRKTGAMHFHLAMPHKENVFMLALRTVPMDSKGVAHILEHTALCGSERFPVRDPFFLMIRRSLNTFMNAFTTSDYTAYPFASQNRQDFGNLLDIYLDAVFFARLDPLDFAQEGHRLEFDEADDPTSNLVYRGIVFNEMKGDSSSPISVLDNQLKKILYPSTTYHFNSGGDPRDIPDLTYEQLLSFYKSHYHPSNAVFMTFGDMKAADLQNEFETKALARFSRSDDKIEVGIEQRFHHTVRAEERYAVDDDSDLNNKTHVVMAWLLGPNTDLKLLLKCNLLSDVLLNTSASPLRMALENTSFGGAPSPLCGLEETHREMSFICGLEGSNLDSADDVEKLIISTLEKVIEKGIEKEKLEACLHQLELTHREIGGDGFPFGLQLIFSCMPAAIHRGDPIDLLDLDPVLESLRKEIEKPDFIQKLVQEILLDNKHRVRLCLYPDPKLNERNQIAEEEELSAKKNALTSEETKKIIQLTQELQNRQNREEPIDVLPKVGLRDIPASFDVPTGITTQSTAGVAVSHFEAGTSGLVYHQVVCGLPQLGSRELRHLPLFTHIVSELGSANRSYIETQHIQHSVSGGISAYSAVRGSVSDPNNVMANVTYSSRSLNRHTKSMMAILEDTFFKPNFSEVSRIRDLIKQIRIRREGSITGAGHTLAMSAASSYFRPISLLNHHLSGLEGIRGLKLLDDNLDNQSDLEEFVGSFGRLHGSLVDSSRELLLVSDPGFSHRALELLEEHWHEVPMGQVDSNLQVPFAGTSKDQAWLTATQVNFCASAFQTVSEDHADAPPLSVLAGVLRNGYLHRVIREQGGAYGGGAGHDSANGVFRFYSYRDPNLMSTFDAFGDSIKWVLDSKLSFDLVEESILGIISSIDAPASPAGEARQAFHNKWFGRDASYRQTMRKNVLSVSVEDVQRVASEYLSKTCARVAVTSEINSGELDDSFVISQI
jgi:hypothetical protein